MGECPTVRAGSRSMHADPILAPVRGADVAVRAVRVDTALVAWAAGSAGAAAIALPRRLIVESFVFGGISKSELGWDFLGLIDGGRFKEYADDGRS